jgi:hypothetical protein
LVSDTEGGTKSEGVREYLGLTGEWRKLHNEELNDLNCSPNIFRVIKSRRMRQAGNVARVGERRGVYRCFVGET